MCNSGMYVLILTLFQRTLKTFTSGHHSTRRQQSKLQATAMATEAYTETCTDNATPQAKEPLKDQRDTGVISDQPGGSNDVLIIGVRAWQQGDITRLQ